MGLRFITFIFMTFMLAIPAYSDEVYKGFADLRSHDFEKSGAVELSGDWEFYWRKTYSDIKSASFKIKNNKRFIEVPGSWTDVEFDGKVPSNTGYATYRIRLNLKDGDEIYSLIVYEINSAFRLYVNGRLINESGKFSVKSDEVKLVEDMVLASFKGRSGENEIVIEVANRDDHHAGIIKPIVFGLNNQIVGTGFYKYSLSIFLFGCLVIMGLFHLGIFAFRREDKASLYFGLFALVIALRTIITGERFFYILFDNFPWNIGIRIEFATVLSAAFFFVYIYYLYKDYFNLLYLKIFLVISVILGGITVFGPPYVFMELNKIYHFCIILISIHVIRIILNAIKEDSRTSILMVSGFFIMMMAALTDMLSYWLIIDSPYMLPLGMVIFIFFQSVLMSLKNLETHRSVKTLTEKLNKNMDHIFELKERTESIKNELIMARKIQRQLIPHDSPSVNLNALYKPMDLVGGDFYDFINFRDSDEVGIFISDVSGHGIAAAFVTSMIKSLILESGPFRNNPALLMNHLNGILFGSTGGNFITAFYGVYNRSTRKMIYSNAGHDHPFIIKKNDVEVVNGAKSVPLAIFSNDELVRYEKEFTNDEFIMDEKSKFLLFTDGLIENMGYCKVTRELENKAFKQYLIDISYLSSRRYLDALYRKLIECKGSELFDDDICVICMDA